MVRAAMSTGDGGSFWPDGVSVNEAPNDLVTAFAHAAYIISSSENLMEGEAPPDWMWAFPTELEAHFERVKRDRDKKYGRGGGDDESGGEWVSNSYAEELRR